MLLKTPENKLENQTTRDDTNKQHRERCQRKHIRGTDRKNFTPEKCVLEFCSIVRIQEEDERSRFVQAFSFSSVSFMLTEFGLALTAYET